MLKFLTRFSALMAVLIVSALPLDAFAIRPRYKAVSYNTSRPAFERLVRGLTPTMDIRPGKLSQLDSDPQTVLDASNLTMWLDPNAGVTTVDGKVSQWDASDTSGISFTQGTASARPILSRSDNKENRQPNSEAFDTSAWVEDGLTISGNTVTASTGNGNHRIYAASTGRAYSEGSGTKLRLRYDLKYVNHPYIGIFDGGGADWDGASINLQTCSFDTGTASYTGSSFEVDADGHCIAIIEYTQSDTATTVIPQPCFLETSGKTSCAPFSPVGTEQFELYSVSVQRSTSDDTYIATTGTPVYPGINGNKGLVFLGGQELGSTSTYDDLVNAGDKTLYLALKPFDLPTTADHILYVGGNGLKTTTNAFQFRNYSGGGYTVDESGAVNTTAIVKITHASATTLGISSDTGSGFSTPTTVGTGSTGTMAGVITLGNETSGSAYFNGYILDIITADASSQADVEAYLQAKYFNVVNPRVNQIDSTIGSVSFTQGTDGAKPLLTEGSRRENLFSYSEELDNAAYTKNSTSVTANATTNPINGETTADKVVEAAASAQHNIGKTFSAISGVRYRLSFYAKSDDSRWVELRSFGAFANDQFLTVNLTNGDIESSTGTIISSSVEDLGSGWYRIEVVRDATSTTSGQFYAHLHNTTARTYLGDGSSGVYIWGMQVQRATMSPTYIPTNALPRHGSLTGQRGLRGDSTDYLATAAYNSATDFTGDFSLFAIVEPTGFSSSTNYTILDNETFNTKGLIWRLEGDNVDSLGMNVRTNQAAAFTQTETGGIFPIFPHVPVVASAHKSSTSASLFFDLDSYKTGTLNNAVSASTNATGLMAQDSGSQPLDGYFYRAVGYKKALPTSTRQRLIKGFKRFYRVN